MNQVDNSFLQLMRIALGNATRFCSPLSVEEWKWLLDMSAKQGVVGVTFSGVERLPKEQMPPLKILMDWLAVVRYIESENRHLNRVYVKVSEMFERDGKRACIVKGVSLGVLYPEPLRRQFGDVDVWMAGGYKAVIKYVRQKFPNVNGGHYGRHIEIEKDGVLVEVHFMPAELYNVQHYKYLQNFYREIESEPWNCRATLYEGGSIVVPKLSDSLIIVVVHLFSHLAVEGVGMKQVVDCYWLLKALDKSVEEGSADGLICNGKSADEIRMESMAFFRKLGIGRFVAALMYVLQQLGMDETQMLCVPDVKLGKRLLDEILDTGTVSVDELVTGKYGNESKLHRLYRRFRRALRLMPMAPSEMFWMLYSGISYWILRKK